MTLRQTTLFGKVTKQTKSVTLRGGGGGGSKVNVIVTLSSAKVVWKCPPQG